MTLRGALCFAARSVAQFLERQGFKEQALEVSKDPDHRFELALQVRGRAPDAGGRPRYAAHPRPP